MSGLIIPIAAEYTGKKAFKEAQRNINNLERGAKNLARVFGASLSAAAVVAFGKATVKAFAEDEAAATRLAKVVDNLGLGFANVQVAGFISGLEKSASVADDELRPAFQALLTTTGSLTKSQELLAQAIDISRGSGIDLATVAQDLANGYVGITKGLKKYNLGLTQAELKSASFEDIMGKLNKQFSGSNAQFLKTYAGQMQVLSVTAQNAQEVIGKGLVDALVILTGQTNGVQGLADAMSNVAEEIGYISTGLAEMIKEFKAIPILGKVFDALGWSIKNSPLGLILGAASGKGKTLASSALAPASANSHLADLMAASNAAAAKKAEQDAAKRAKALLAAQKAQTKALKDQATLKKAASIFDLNQIQIIAALKGKISDEDRKRLELQLAIETDNVAQAQKLTYELAKSQGLTDALAKTLASLPAAQNPFVAWKGYLDEVELQAKRIAAMGGGANAKTWTPTDTTGLAPAVAATVQGIDQATLDALSAADEAQKTIDAINQYLAGYNSSSTGQIVNKIEVTLDGKVIAESVQNQANSGNNTGFSRLGDWRTL